MKGLYFVEKRQGYSVVHFEVDSLEGLEKLKEFVSEVEEAYKKAQEDEKEYLSVGGMQIHPRFNMYFKFKNYRPKKREG